MTEEVLKAIREVWVELGAALGEATVTTEQICNPAKLRQFAREEYEARSRRKRIFESELFGEPTWDMLLDLYVADADEVGMPVTSLCIASNVPPSTALRWIRILEDRGHIVRQPSSSDKRVTLLKLSRSAKANLDSYFAERAMRRVL